MKLHRIELIVVDFESYGVDDICTIIKQANDNSLVRIVSTSSVDVGDDYWTDHNIINSNKATPSEITNEFVQMCLSKSHLTKDIK